MDGRYKGVGGWEGGGVGGGGGRAAGGGLNVPLGLFRVAMSPRSASHRPDNVGQHKRRLTNSGLNSRHLHPK